MPHMMYNTTNKINTTPIACNKSILFLLCPRPCLQTTPAQTLVFVAIVCLSSLSINNAVEGVVLCGEWMQWSGELVSSADDASADAIVSIW